MDLKPDGKSAGFVLAFIQQRQLPIELVTHIIRGQQAPNYARYVRTPIQVLEGGFGAMHLAGSARYGPGPSH